MKQEKGKMINKKDFMLCGKIKKEDISKLNGDYLANIKFDGERILAVIQNGEVFLFNRRGKLKNSYYREVEQELKTLNNCILDGEVISFDDNFNKLQRRALTTDKFKQEQLRKEIPVKYMVFDILQTGTCELRFRKLKSRLQFLKNLIDFSLFNFVEVVEYKPIMEMLARAEQEDREGIIIKNMDSQYERRRSNNWLKLKFFKTTELRLVKYAENNNGIRCEDKNLNAVQIAGKQHLEVKNKIDSEGYCEVIVQYLEKTKLGRLRFISYKELKENVER